MTTFSTADDRKTERNISDVLEKEWNCKIYSFGSFSPIDSYAEKEGRLLSLLEYKNRSNTSDKYPSVFLSVRKWLSLTLGAIGLGCRAIFVVRFTDGIFWIPIEEVPANQNRVTGRRDRNVSNDIEPIIDVPISLMERI